MIEDEKMWEAINKMAKDIIVKKGEQINTIKDSLENVRRRSSSNLLAVSGEGL